MQKNSKRFYRRIGMLLSLSVLMNFSLVCFAEEAFKYGGEPFQAEEQPYVEPAKPNQYPGTPIEIPWFFIGSLIIGYALIKCVTMKSLTLNGHQCKKVSGKNIHRQNKLL